MSDVQEQEVTNPTELLATGRRNLAVRDYHAATEALAKACEYLAKEHGDTADQCAEAYLWYGKALLGLSREESGVLGDGMPGGNADAEEDDEDQEDGENGDDNVENGEEQNGEGNEETPAEPEKAAGEVSKGEQGSSNDQPAGSSSGDSEKPGPSNGEAADESMVDLENEDDVDNLQLAWEMLDLARSILRKRAEKDGGASRAQLAEVHLALGEVALESETYDKAVIDMQSCLEIQKELYSSDDRRIAETHYQIGLANSLASSFEDAITHFKNAANILETRIRTLENPATVKDDATVKKYSTADPFYSVEGEIKELKELLPEIQEKIQDMMDYKTEKSPLSEYLFLPWLGVTLRGLMLRQVPTVAALVYTMAIVDGSVNPLFLTAFIFLFLLESRVCLEIARAVRVRWERREHAAAVDGSTHYEIETLWSNDDVQSVEVRNYVY